jgi:radical SAM family uncharacterized protein/radical SAM-linked protein
MNHPYADFVHRVDKPARYLGGEYQSVKKEWDAVEVRFCLAFPDVYDIGMSHLGTKILYSQLNKFKTIACERAFTPWPDMERELRARGLPLVSLESARPLRDFDAIGCSLQYELTYSNVLTLLDLGGIPLRARDRGERDPIVWAGGPTATHPEPVAPFFDCFLIGEAEEALPRLLRLDADHRRQGLSRGERLARLAAAGGVYVPSLYATRVDARSQLEVVDRPLDARAPARVHRELVQDLDAHPFPDDTPVPWAEAVFDRVSVEIARGCTEGCRFCQAGMIYRPVRERSPESIVESLVGAVKKGGYDEASLTSLSTADFSCITPLVKKVASRLADDKVSLSVSSLRAYGLGGELLDEIAKVRAGGLTFAPEAGTQRMRDVINKNVTEEDIARSAENVFARGWDRMKLYFMIGLPTETDEDVAGIAQTGGRLKRQGRRIRRDAEVTVSVSSHVPKPHTPFQWCAMDSVDELLRKQRLLKETARAERVDLKWHEARVSWLEGIFARGDRRLSDVLESAWRDGARFDSWEEHLRLDVWERAFARHGVDAGKYLKEIPLDGALPWDHLDVGLEDGFLEGEWRRAQKSRGSPPCGKPAGTLLHHDNVEEALADERRLVCYDCGVACDLTEMREERLVHLRTLGALRRSGPPADARTIAHTGPALERRHMQPRAAFAQGEGTRYRLRYTKLGRAAYISHLDTSRLLQRLLRRADLGAIYSRGFHPKPDFVYGPALALGVAALGELVDVRLDGEWPPGELLLRLRAVAPEGVRLEQVARLGGDDPPLAKVLALADYAALLPDGAVLPDRGPIDPATLRPVVRVQKGERRTVDVARHVVELRRAGSEEDARLRALLAWPAGGGALLVHRVRVGGDGSARPAEVVEALLGAPAPSETRHARLALWAERAAPDGSPRAHDPLDLPPLQRPRSPRAPSEGVAANG